MRCSGGGFRGGTARDASRCRHLGIGVQAEVVIARRRGAHAESDQPADTRGNAHAHTPTNRHHAVSRRSAVQIVGISVTVGAYRQKCAINGHAHALYKLNIINVLTESKQVFACNIRSVPANFLTFGKFPLDHGFGSAKHSVSVGKPEKASQYLRMRAVAGEKFSEARCDRHFGFKRSC